MLGLFRVRWVVAGCLVTLLASSCSLDRVPESGGDGGSGGTAGSGGGGDAGKGGSAGGKAGAGALSGAGGASAGTAAGSGNGNGASAGEGGDAGDHGLSGGAGEPGRGGGAGDEAGDAGEGGRSHAGEGGSSGSSGGAGGTSSGGASGSAGASGSGGSGGAECVEITLAPFAPDNLEWPSRAGEIAGFFNLGTITLSGSVRVEYRLDEGGGRQVGLIPLGDGVQGDFATCTHCVTARDSQGRSYIATAGTLDLDEDSDQVHGYPQGEILNVTLREATIHPTSWETYVLPYGICLFFTSQTLDIDPVGTWTQCPPEFREDGDCDCGCGDLDPTCSSASANQCDYCWCPGDRGSCSPGTLVDASNNAVCSPE